MKFKRDVDLVGAIYWYILQDCCQKSKLTLFFHSLKLDFIFYTIHSFLSSSFQIHISSPYLHINRVVFFFWKLVCHIEPDWNGYQSVQKVNSTPIISKFEPVEIWPIVFPVIAQETRSLSKSRRGGEGSANPGRQPSQKKLSLIYCLRSARARNMTQLAIYGNFVVQFKVRGYKLGRFLPKSEEIENIFWYYLNWNHAEQNKIGPIFLLNELFHK